MPAKEDEKIEVGVDDHLPEGEADDEPEADTHTGVTGSTYTGGDSTLTFNVAVKKQAAKYDTGPSL